MLSYPQDQGTDLIPRNDYKIRIFLVMSKRTFIEQKSEITKILGIMLVIHLVNECLLTAYYLSGTVLEVQW